ncbi:MAG: hypothetical protein K2K70_01905, partial [Lachnospiraceae bacterium]|nr:hypothetical protein [Lachnospiraceae bacterium]
SILLCCLITSCEQSSETPTQNTIEKPTVHYKIGICQTSTDSYDSSLTQGFQKALEQSLPLAQITILTKNADNTDTLASRCLELEQAKPDLLFLANTGSAIPVDTTGLQTPIINSPTYDTTEQVAETLHKLLPEINQLGILYHSADHTAVAKTEKMTKYLDKKKIPYQTYPADDISAFYSGANDICDQCDAAYIPSDKLAVEQAAKLEDIFLPAGIPLISDHNAFHAISMATVTLDYYNLGYQLGELAANALQNYTGLLRNQRC